MPPYRTPESVNAYFQEPTTRAVVDSLVSTLDDPVLPDMDRHKLQSLSEGILLACQIRADFVGFMADLWANTFGAALEKSDLNEIFPDDCTIKEVWSERYFWSYITRGDNLECRHFDLSVQIDQRSHAAMLRVWRYDENEELEAFEPHLQIPDGWHRTNDEDGSPMLETTIDVTIRDLIANSDEELAKLSGAASAVIKLICGLLPK